MKCHQFAEQTSFDEDTRTVMDRAFDEIWDEVASNFSDPIAIEAARRKLMNALLAQANEIGRDFVTLKCAGLKAITGRYDY